MFKYLEPDKTCVLIHETKVIYESKENSVKPFVKYIYYHGLPKENTILIDKVIGVAIANVALYCKLNTVYGLIISKPALDLLQKNNVNVHYETLVDHILRRDKTDICPMEKKILTANSYEEAFNYLKQIVIDNNPIHLK
ncbi:DUF1893 domain-containing protein [Mycoplasmatota bacterium]|nr:DUF1893 domain-containing protein [Mycoplasmatota bacterium]